MFSAGFTGARFGVSGLRDTMRSILVDFSFRRIALRNGSSVTTDLAPAESQAE
jgi:hypothetical protein